MNRAEIDENGVARLFYGESVVESCTKIEGQDNVYNLRVGAILERSNQLEPLPGQFYLIKSTKSAVAYDRPISVYRSSVFENQELGYRELKVEFLILEKGKGTMELCSLMPGDMVELIGPLGKGFKLPEECIQHDPNDKEKFIYIEEKVVESKICIVGGGIGVAPVANFAASLPPESYDFYASFKSGSYGLEHLNAKNLYITTDDGSKGTKGMLSAALTKEAVAAAGYKYLYACGPIPMLAYIQSLCAECGIKCFLSMENKMLCGVGACLGCTIETTEGMLRVCKDGPVFPGEILKFEKPNPRRKPLDKTEKPDLSVDICGIHFNNPVIAASGTFGFGENYRGISDVNVYGGISGKGVTYMPKPGNKGVRIVEVTGGNINSIGLQNPGIPHFIEHELPQMLKLKPVAIANLAGSDIDSYVKGAQLLDKTEVPMIELNISCPNVKSGGQAWGVDPKLAYKCVKAVRKATSKPLMVKLSPNAPDMIAVAMACIKAGADALSLINTIQAVSIDIEKGRPAFNNVKAGLCGPAIKPIALRMVYDLAQAMKKLPESKRVPIVGMGGIEKWEDAVEFIMAGADAIQIGASKFANPLVAEEVLAGLEKFMQSHGYKNLSEMKGIAL